MIKLTEAIHELADIFDHVIESLNGVHTNIWAVLLVMLAVGLFQDGKDTAALAISSGAFAMLQAQEKKS
jgi:hypothetical protein